MVFDPSTSKKALEQGFTTCRVEDLPSDLPSRSRADNLYDSEDFPTADQRNNAFSTLSADDKVSAWAAAQSGVKAGTSDAREVGLLTVGDYEDNGLGKYGKGHDNPLRPDTDNKGCIPSEIEDAE